MTINKRCPTHYPPPPIVDKTMLAVEQCLNACCTTLPPPLRIKKTAKYSNIQTHLWATTAEPASGGMSAEVTVSTGLPVTVNSGYWKAQLDPGQR